MLSVQRHWPQFLIVTVLVLFSFYFFPSGTSADLWQHATALTRVPDFSHYVPLHTLSDTEFPTHDPHRRVIVLGDVHGMYEPFQALLDQVSYDPSADVLVHVGDIITKGPPKGSLAVLSYMAHHNITGVRGNHDQKVIEWRSWLEWVRKLGGARWLAQFHAAAHAADPADPERWAAKYLKASKSRWSRTIPRGWKPLSEHYRLASDMSSAEYEYLLSLPLVLHAPSAHVFVAHAGVLPSDPHYKPTHRRQPLARVPAFPDGYEGGQGNSEEARALLRRVQEAAVLAHVPQNGDPWVTLNMRGVLADRSITRDQDGTPWAEVWNYEMGLCTGFEPRRQREAKLPCYPATVVYGHAAFRNLDIKRWSVGLDSGCVYNRRLSALVLDYHLRNTTFEGEVKTNDQVVAGQKKRKTIPFGEGSALVVDVECK
ncbi:Metallo-dependent phosphatase-like protein [Mycena pura]|uniref:Metallo-dependent phosphatase-like protein n=1 Tax=Mycena pura TaxID=153505 RepID=A0AAD6YRI6_9AGAR|nr:Metallo-dependent phosphatase-like protein [Mycena pura]